MNLSGLFIQCFGFSFSFGLNVNALKGVSRNSKEVEEELCHPLINFLLLYFL